MESTKLCRFLWGDGGTTIGETQMCDALKVWCRRLTSTYSHTKNANTPAEHSIFLFRFVVVRAVTTHKTHDKTLCLTSTNCTNTHKKHMHCVVARRGHTKQTLMWKYHILREYHLRADVHVNHMHQREWVRYEYTMRSLPLPQFYTV